jgi:hypothetical protein
MRSTSIAVAQRDDRARDEADASRAQRVWMRKAIPGIVYDQAHEDYDTMALAALRTQGVRTPIPSSRRHRRRRSA